jgi:hypothetical protein
MYSSMCAKNIAKNAPKHPQNKNQNKELFILHSIRIVNAIQIETTADNM